MVRLDADAEIPESGAVFTFGKSRFCDNIPSKFWIRNDSIKQVACGDEHTIIVTGNGRVYVFGNNDWGQLGVGKTKTVSKPTVIKSLKHEKAIWAAGGRFHSLVATESGKVYSFGANGEGQLGTGDAMDRSEPTIIHGLEELSVFMVAAGSYHSAVVTGSGKLYVFGSNSEGQLGLENDVKNVAVPVELQLAVNITSVACGYYHTAVIGDGKVYTFGEKEGGKLGLLEKQLTKGSNRPQCIFSISEKVSAVSCGGNHSAAVTECGKLYTFGSGLNGQLGLGTMVMETGLPSLVGALDGHKVTGISCGESHTAIITEQGKLYTCGEGRHGKLGLGNENFSNHYNPVYIKKFADFFVHQVACGGCHMLVLVSARLHNDPANTVVGDESGEVDLSDDQENSDMGIVARSRRRHKGLQGKPLPAIDPTIQGSGLDSMPKKAVAPEKIDDLEEHLIEMDRRFEEDAKHDRHKTADDIGSVVSEVSQSQFNKIHEMSATSANVNKSVSLKTVVTSPNPDVHKSENNEETREEKELISERAVIKSNVKDLKKEPEASEDEEEESSEDDDDDDDNNSEMKTNLEKSQMAVDDQNQKECEDKLSKFGETNSSTENASQKKESFLKKIFSFKKKRSKSKLPEMVKEGSESNSIVSPADPLTTTSESIDLPSDSTSIQNAENVTSKEIEQSITSNEGPNENVKSKEESTNKKVVSAKSIKEKSKAVSSQSSKACNII